MFIPSFNVKSNLRCCKSYVYDNNTINELHKSNGIHSSKVLIINYTPYLYFVGHIAVTCQTLFVIFLKQIFKIV